MSLAAPPRSSLACRLAVALATVLLVAACTKKTVVREVPAPSAAAATATPDASPDGASAAAPGTASDGASDAAGGSGTTGMASATATDAATDAPSGDADVAFADATAVMPPARAAGAIDPDAAIGLPGSAARSLIWRMSPSASASPAVVFTCAWPPGTNSTEPTVRATSTGSASGSSSPCETVSVAV